MEEKKKKIVNTNLGILLICLFCSVFTLADFLVVDHILGKYFDYSKCNCPKCVDSNLNLDGFIDNKKDEDDNIDTTTVVDEKNIYTNADVAGLYSKTFNLEKDESGNIMNVYYALYLAEDGTFVYDAAWYIGFSYIGNYYIEGDRIVLNFLFRGGHEPIFSKYYGTSTLKINSVNEITDSNIFIYSDKIGTSEVILVKETDASEERMNYFKTQFKSIIENSEYHNKRNETESN